MGAGCGVGEAKRVAIVLRRLKARQTLPSFGCDRLWKSLCSLQRARLWLVTVDKDFIHSYFLFSQPVNTDLPGILKCVDY